MLRPAVHQVDRADAAQLRTELPFPCVWVAPRSRADGIGPLRDTPVHLDSHPTYWMAPGIPYDSCLSDFLVRGEAVIGSL